MSENIESVIREIDAIKASRETRDSWALYETAIRAIDTLISTFARWIDEELADLEREINLLLPIAGERARNRLNEYRNRLVEIREEYNKRWNQLKELSNDIKNRKLKSPGEINEKFSNEILPAVLLLHRIYTIRETIDSMADMIPRQSSKAGEIKTYESKHKEYVSRRVGIMK